MEQIIMMIEKTADYYDAYSVNCDGIYAAGKDIAEVKRNTLDAIRLIKENLAEEQYPAPLRGEYSLSFRFDTRTFLDYYRDSISLAGLEKITGIHQKQLSNYLNNRSKPRQSQIDRINKGIHRFATELLEISI